MICMYKKNSSFCHQVELVFPEVGLCGSASQTQEATVVNQPLCVFFVTAPGCLNQMMAINHEINIKALREEM